MTDFIPTPIITGEQIRGARVMLRLDQKQFAALTHVTVGMIRRMERTRGPVTAATGILEAMRIALEQAGIEIIEAGYYEGIGGPGLRMRGEPVAADEVIDMESAIEERQAEERAVPDAS